MSGGQGGPFASVFIWKCGGGAAAVGGGIGVTLLAADYLRYRYLRMIDIVRFEVRSGEFGLFGCE